MLFVYFVCGLLLLSGLRGLYLLFPKAKIKKKWFTLFIFYKISRGKDSFFVTLRAKVDFSDDFYR